MKRNDNLWIGIMVLVGLVFPPQAMSQDAGNSDVQFHWAPSPVFAESGDALSPAVEYQVWVTLDEGSPQMLAAVKDTIYTLSVNPGVVHRLSVRGVDALGRISSMSPLSAPVYFAFGDRSVPSVASLGTIYPNPFNPETSIMYNVPAGSDGLPMSLEIFNIAGKRVRVLETESTPGQHEASWNGTDDAGQPAASGIYMTRFMCGALVDTKKMTMLK